jgi:Cof subfamily protein (haloacid dehalogenase superfamily)
MIVNRDDYTLRIAVLNLPVFTKLPKAVALDLDGTLLNDRLEVSKRNSLAINRCLARGLPILVATARTERSTRRLIGENLAAECSLVLQNGSVSMAATPLTGRLRITITPELATAIIQLVLKIEPGIRVTVELEGYEFGCNEVDDAEKLWQLNSAMPDMVLSIDEAISRVPSKIAVSSKGRNLSILCGLLTKNFGNDISVVPSNDMTFLNIVSIKASKSNALKYLLDTSNISLAEVLAFGDDVPDLDMLSVCGIPVAMANAFPEVKQICNYTTASNNEDSVAIVLENMLLEYENG